VLLVGSIFVFPMALPLSGGMKSALKMQNWRRRSPLGKGAFTSPCRQSAASRPSAGWIPEKGRPAKGPPQRLPQV